MCSERRRGFVACALSSDQIGWRLPVLASITTIGCPCFSERPMSVTGAARLRRRSMPGTSVTRIWPGLKPSDQL
jgi:hypothetical protein